eukprot:scaffold140733_cov136-Phaeocystis_antarctica.AAC.1
MLFARSRGGAPLQRSPRSPPPLPRGAPTHRPSWNHPSITDRSRRIACASLVQRTGNAVETHSCRLGRFPLC